MSSNIVTKNIWGKLILLPTLFYFLFFCLLTYPAIFRFSSHLLADQIDGLQNVWNLWWINKAILQLGQSPWQTVYLNFPHGTSLLGHTLNPLSGLMGLLLLRYLSLFETYNFIVIFTFVASGLTMFWLAYYFSRAYWGSLFGGYIFTFSSYHFAHAQGHLNLISLEWLPLFLLCWFMLLRRPSLRLASAALIILVATLLCDYYYFIYGLLLAGMATAWSAIRQRDLFFFIRRAYLAPLAVFLLGLLLTSGPLIVSLLLLNSRDPLLGAHKTAKYSMDLLAPFIYGGHWRFNHLTAFYWAVLPGNTLESSVHVGLSVLFLLAYVWLKRQRLAMPGLGLWYVSLVFFWLLSLGPVLRIWNQEITAITLPYYWVAELFPPLKLSGVPVRMMSLVFLSAAIISAAGFKLLLSGPTGPRFGAVLLLLLLFFEYLPTPLPATQIPTPGYVQVLKDLPPSEAGVAEALPETGGSLPMYYQTIHEKPLAFGYTSRTLASVDRKNEELRQLIRHKKFSLICRGYNIRYLVTTADFDPTGVDLAGPLLYSDQQVNLYDLGSAGACDTSDHIVSRALTKDGWIIGEQLLSLTGASPDPDLTLGVEQFLAAEKREQKIAVDVSMAVDTYKLDEFQRTLQAHLFYRDLLKRQEPDRELYVAVNTDASTKIFAGSPVQLLLENNQVKLIVVNWSDEVVTKWVQ